MSVIIDGKTYDETKFSPDLQNYLTVRQEIQLSKIRQSTSKIRQSITCYCYLCRNLELDFDL